MDTEKYSLRQRQKRRHIMGRIVDSQGYVSDNSNESLQNIMPSKEQSFSNGKSKSKAAPLSKYRRKTANARERTRMREINSAFENLRHCVPACITNEDVGSTNEKLTKITTLRLAMKYIRVLSDALVNPQKADNDFLYDCVLYKPHDRVCVESSDEMDAQVLCLGEEKSKKLKVLTPKLVPSRKTSFPKRQSKKEKPKHIVSTIPNACQTSPASSAYASLTSSDSSASPVSTSPSYHFDSINLNSSTSGSSQHHSMSDLSNLMLESDGESINLSERCLSPLHTKHKISSLSSTDLFECSPSDMSSLENPLELSLRLMDPVDSLTFSPVRNVPSPSSCFSPLLSLEPLGTFDIFQSDFNEHVALDLFLS